MKSTPDYISPTLSFYSALSKSEIQLVVILVEKGNLFQKASLEVTGNKRIERETDWKGG